MYMEKGLDTGDMLAKVVVPITTLDDNGTMHEKLSAAGAQLLLATLPDFLAGKITAIPQNHAEAIFARTIRREDEQIHWNRKTTDIINQIRGLHPWPIAYTNIQGEIFKVWRAEEVALQSLATMQWVEELAGTIVALMKDRIVVRTGDGVIALTHVQPAGKKALSCTEYLNGKPLSIGMSFG